MSHRISVFTALFLVLGLLMPNVAAEDRAPQPGTAGLIGSLHGDLAAAGLPRVGNASIHWGDYDLDGDLDLVLTAGNSADYVTRVYRNDGAALFTVVAQCSTASGVTTCEGDQSGGVLIPSSVPVELWVQNLTGDITPADSVSGISAGVVGGGAQDGAILEIHFESGGRAILTQGDGAHGITGTTLGSTGYRGGDDYGGFNPFYPVSYGGNGGTGHVGGGVLVDNDGAITTAGKGAHGIFVWSQGGNGGHGGHAGAIAYAEGGNGGAGGLGDSITVLNQGTINTHDSGSHGMFVVSQGGTGGGGGDAGATAAAGGHGGTGGQGGFVTVENDGTIFTDGDGSHGLFALSQGGTGGGGGDCGGAGAVGGSGGGGGRGGNVAVTNHGGITTEGVESHGILAQGMGGTGGSGGTGGGIYGGGGGANPSGAGGMVDVANTGAIQTDSTGSNGILAQSIGGFGGGGGGGGGIVSFGGIGATGGNGDSARINNQGNVTTRADDARGLMAQSIGGGGGTGAGSGGIVALGGEGSAGGHGGYVAITNSGEIRTQGDYADGIQAQSIGGGGGNGAGSGGLVAIGGGGSSTGDGAGVEVDNSGAILVTGDYSHAIMAQSVGGGGGSGAGSGGLVSIGGSGDAGGSGGDATVANSGALKTEGVDASAIFVQSVGGGGGNGGSAGGIAAFGGDGSVTSNGGNVTVENSGNIQTGLEHPDEERPEATTGSHAIFAQSIGGGGGNGGSGKGWFTIGGSGGGGGDAGVVIVENAGSLLTRDDNSSAIFAQSVGGGGGNGGGADANSTSIASVAIGGSGAGGGDGDSVNVSSHNGSVSTQGNNSHGILAQSVGGGGGNGGFAVSTSGESTPVRVAVGGKAGAGGDGGIVNVSSGSNIVTAGTDAHGITAQSIGGGGGTGGFAVAANYAGSVSWNVAVGGSGGQGGDGDAVTVGTELDALKGSIATSGDRSSGIMAQSIGGGGGNGGFAVTGALLSAATVGLSLGGSGGTGGHGEAVDVVSDANITTTGEAGHGILAQSIGGGGGAGGWTIAAGVTAFGGATVSLGGGGGAGSEGGVVDVASGGIIQTEGDFAHGIMAQSIGGGGGAGGMSGSAMINFSGLIPPPPSIPLTIGANFSVAVGGDGGTGGYADSVTVTNTGDIVTEGDFSQGIVAQSIGGGGGAGGKSIAATGNIDVPNPGSDYSSVEINVDFALALGGDGGSGNHGGNVEVVQDGLIYTEGDGAHGITAQSIGGGGGIGGNARAMTVGLDPNEWVGGAYVSPEVNVTVNVAVGGSGGSGGDGGNVTVANNGDIVTEGADAHGIMAQSIGGGGGAGGGGYHGLDWEDFGVPNSLVGDFDLSQFTDLVNAQIVVGGTGGSTGNGSMVDIDNSGSILTLADGSFGILAQSIGGGGGIGGVGAQGDGKVGVGGGGGSAGNGGKVAIGSGGPIETHGAAAHAIFAQSIGGGGGIGGNIDGGTRDYGFSLTIGQSGGSAGHGDSVTVDVTHDVVTHGSGANGIFAQSVGGGGGLAGDLGDGSGFAGSAGGDGSGGAVNVSLQGSITTYGDASHGIVAQSVGGQNDAVYVFVPDSQQEDAKPSLADGPELLDESTAKSRELTGRVIAQDEGVVNDQVVFPDRGSPVTDETPSRSDGAIGLDGSISESQGQTHESTMKGKRGLNDHVSIPETDSPYAGVLTLLPDLADVGSDVSVKVDGSVLAHGANSHGIIAQSAGDDGSGDITIDIVSGTVQGGTGSSIGVRVLGGEDNSLINYGTITTLNGADGTAIQATGGNETIDNFGTITGSVDLGVGTNLFNNHTDATFAAGSIINLGTGGAVANDGTFSPGGADVTMTTSLTGSFSQSATGVFEATLSGSEYDQLLLGGGSTANLDGTLKVVFGDDAFHDGTTYDIISAADSSQITGGFSDLELPQTAFLEFGMTDLGETLQLEVDVKSFGSSANNPLEQAIADCLDLGLFDSQGDLSQMMGAFQQATAEQVEEGFATLSPDTYDNLTRGSLQSMRLYQDVLAQRLDAARTNPYTGAATAMAMGSQGRNGWWLSGATQAADQDASGGYLAHNFNTSAVLGGYERFYSSSILGLSIGTTRSEVDRTNDMVTGTVDAIGGVLYGAHLWGPSFLQGMVSYEGQKFENRREIQVGPEQRVAEGKYDGSAITALATAGLRLNPGSWGLEPFVSLRYAHLNEDGFTETGAGAANLIVDPRTTDWLGSDLGIRLSRGFLGGSSAFIPELLLAWNHDFGIDDRTVVAAFEGDPSNKFTIDGQDVSRDGATLGAGLTFVSSGGWKASLRYDRLQRSDFQTNRISIRLGSAF